MSDNEKRKDDRVPVAMRVKLRYPDLDAFIERYSGNISKGGIFIVSKNPKPVGTLLRFELTLTDSTRLIRGEGTVVWIKEFDPKSPKKPHGMGLKFTKLDAESKSLVLRVLEFKKKKEQAATKADDQQAPEPAQATDQSQTAKEQPLEAPGPEPGAHSELEPDAHAEPEPDAHAEPEPDARTQPEPGTAEAETASAPPAEPEPAEAQSGRTSPTAKQAADAEPEPISQARPDAEQGTPAAADPEPRSDRAGRPLRSFRRAKPGTAALSGDVQQLLDDSEGKQDLVKATMARLKKKPRPPLDRDLEALIGATSPDRSRKPFSRRSRPGRTAQPPAAAAGVAADSTDPQPMLGPAELEHDVDAARQKPARAADFPEYEPTVDEEPAGAIRATEPAPSTAEELDGVLRELEDLEPSAPDADGTQAPDAYQPSELDAQHMSALELQSATKDLEPLPEEAQLNGEELDALVVDTTDIEETLEPEDDYRGEPIMPKPPPPPPSALEAQGLDADSLEGLDEALALEDFERPGRSDDVALDRAVDRADIEFEKPAVAEPGESEPARHRDVKFGGDDEEVDSDLSAALQSLQSDADEPPSSAPEPGLRDKATGHETADFPDDQHEAEVSDEEDAAPDESDQPEQEGEPDEPRLRKRKKSGFFKRLFGK